MCVKNKIPDSSVPVTQIGDYGTKGSPTGEVFYDELYEGTTISFTAASGDEPAKIADSQSLFADKLLQSEMPIRISTTSGTNDGNYAIAARGVSRGEIRLGSSYSLTTESASTAGTVTIDKIAYKPNITRGCPSCGSLNTRRGD
jgi:hypothetical protein